ncbi:MAG: membrane protein [Nitrosomonas sp.]|nr:MAG: membrane protein [Nitrosomonas sp.]
MEAIIAEKSTSQIIDGNIGNTGNSMLISSNNKSLDDVDVYPTIVSNTGNRREQTGKKDTEQKCTQAAELPKDSEFAVIENCKGLKDGIYWQEPFGTDDAPKPPIFLCSPLIVVAQTRDIAQSNWGRLLSWQDNDGHAHTWACPVEMLVATDTAEFRRELARNGLTIATNGKARQKLGDYVLNFPPQSQDRVRCVTKTGWHDTRYVLSNSVYGKQEGERVIYQGVTNGDFASAGHLADWQREVAARAVGNTRIVFAISCAFAGPLVEMANESGGGFQFTGETSKGKTSTIIDPAASVWGHPDRFAKKWRTTTNGLETLCLSRNDSTLILDDLGQSDAKECGQAAYLIANGQGKVRMQKEGGNRPLPTWKTLILSSGEVDIAQHMAEGGKVAKGGQVIRLPSIPADAGAGMFAIEQLHDQPDGRHFSDTMKAVTREYYGAAGESFLNQLTDSTTLKEITNSVRDGIAEIVKRMPIPDGAAPEVGRVAARFALVAFAGELATEFGITGWEKGEAFNAAIRCFHDWLSESGSALGADNKALFAQVSALLQAHGARFPSYKISTEDLQRIHNCAGFSHIEGEKVTYWVHSGAFRNELCKGFNPASAAKSLVNAGWLEPGSDRIQQKKRIDAHGSKGLRFYVLTDKALGSDL